MSQPQSKLVIRRTPGMGDGAAFAAGETEAWRGGVSAGEGPRAETPTVASERDQEEGFWLREGVVVRRRGCGIRLDAGGGNWWWTERDRLAEMPRGHGGWAAPRAAAAFAPLADSSKATHREQDGSRSGRSLHRGPPLGLACALGKKPTRAVAWCHPSEGCPEV